MSLFGPVIKFLSFGLGLVLNAAQRFAAWRSGEFRGTYVRLSTIVY